MRKIKKLPIFILLILIIVIVVFLNYNKENNSSKKKSNNKRQEKVSTSVNKKQMSIVMVGDVLTHDSVLSDAKKDGGTYDFNQDEFSGATYTTPITKDMNNICASNAPIALRSVFNPKTIHCDSGKYLPANSIDCNAICTGNHYCPGGDVQFNETNDGGIFLNSVNLCFSVNKNSKNLEMTNEFMRFLISNEELGNMSKIKRMMTPAKDMSLDEMYASFSDAKAKHLKSGTTIKTILDFN